jgi:hypothetical protein
MKNATIRFLIEREMDLIDEINDDIDGPPLTKEQYEASMDELALVQACLMRVLPN